jgi:outer membrane cobalamin receptor
VRRSFAAPVLAPLLAAVLILACHRQTPEQSAQRSARNVITQAEIDSTRAANVYDLIARLHGDFLRDRGKLSIRTDKRDRAVVFMNDQEYGVLETMRNIPPSRISQIRFFTGLEAVSRYGSQYGGGVVLLTSRNQ